MSGTVYDEEKKVSGTVYDDNFRAGASAGLSRSVFLAIVHRPLSNA